VFEFLIRGCCSKPFAVLALLAAGVLAGVLSLRDLPRDVFPDLATPVFNVIVQNPAMSAEELETGIVVPLEAALGGLPQLRRIRSVAQLGVAQVSVEFEPEADYQRARQYVAERLAQVNAELPAGTDPPLLSSLTGRLNEIFELTLEAEPGAADLMMLRDLADFEVRNRLLAVPGVAAVERLGGFLRQFQVQIDPERMVARNVTLAEILHAVEGANLNASGGLTVQGPMEWTIRAVGRAEDAGDIAATVVAMHGATPVLLGDVTDVRQAPAVRRGVAHRLAGEVVSCRVAKQFGADTVAVAAGIRDAIADLRRSLPEGVVLRVVYDQSELIESALGGVLRAVALGAGFVILVLFLLIGDVRAALIVTLTIPLSIALAGVFLRWAGVGINAMTLGGFAVAVGLLVDAAIIVTENVLHHLGRDTPAPRRDLAVGAAAEVARPITFATLIVVAVFLPLLGMSGIEGKMYRPLAGAVAATVAAALLLALTLVPLAAERWLRPRPGRTADTAAIRYAKARYAPLLEWCLGHAALVRVVTLAVTAPALILAFFVGSDFMPRLDEGAFLLQTQLPAEASLDEVDRLNHRVEDLLREFPEVEEVVRRTGRAERTEDPMPHTLSDVLVVLRRQRTRSLDELREDMRAALARVPGVSTLFTTPLGMRIDEGLGGTPADISVRVFGPDLEQLASLARRVRRSMAAVEGLADLRIEPIAGLPQVRVAIDRAAAARVGLTPGDIVTAARVGLVGEKVSDVWVGQRRYDLVVKLHDRSRADVRAMAGLLVDGHDGTRVPLDQVAKIEETFGPSVIRREGATRRIAVEAEVTGRDLGSVAAGVRARLASELALPAGYFITVGGRVESQVRAFRSLLLSIVLALVLVLVLLYLALGSLAEALVILATLPDAFVGGILALLLAGETWNVSSLVGLIGLFGIAVQNGLVLVSQTRSLLAEGVDFEQALRTASIGRLRPKLMTAGTAILGLLPLLVLPLHGVELERPLAVVMVGGLVTSTLFTLLALPSFYMLVHRYVGRGAVAASPHFSPDSVARARSGP
jgi:cobalt-zinc-cadmium resistance protein CzcA